MTSTPSAAPASGTASGGSIYLSGLLGRPLADRTGEPLGKLADVIVRLRAEYPLVTGLVGAVGGREVFVPVEQVSSLDGEVLKLASARLDLRQFERREGEVLLRADVLGHRLINFPAARLVRAGDLHLTQANGSWVLDAVDTRWRRRRMLGLFGGHEQAHEARDWHEFEPLIGHARSAVPRGPFARIRRLKPAQIADLIEDASKAEETEILGRVHADPELEADVFEELD
jgi:PRC-barrel domain protein